MIRANTRGRLTAADLQLVILLLSRGSAHRRAYLERRLTSEGPDSLLDAPDLAERLLTVRSMLLPSEALSYVLVRHALRGATGRPGPGRYCRLLLDSDNGPVLRALDTTTAAPVLSTSHESKQRRRPLSRCVISQLALWFTGTFPDYIAARAAHSSPDVSTTDALVIRGLGLASGMRWRSVWPRAFGSYQPPSGPALRTGLTACRSRLLSLSSTSPAGPGRSFTIAETDLPGAIGRRHLLVAMNRQDPGGTGSLSAASIKPRGHALATGPREILDALRRPIHRDGRGAERRRAAAGWLRTECCGCTRAE